MAAKFEVTRSKNAPICWLEDFAANETNVWRMIICLDCVFGME